MVEGAQWVGQSTVTGAHFSPCAWSGLWLLGVWSGVAKCGPKSGYDTGQSRKLVRLPDMVPILQQTHYQSE